MCGIVGLINYKDRDLLDNMNRSQFHRGPDGGGSFCSKDLTVCLAMRRLSIVDIEGGIQPMTNEDGSIHLVFNGEIFNAAVLRQELVKKGHVFVTESSDTEVLVHLYEEDGEKMLNRLNGMFAFAVYDERKKTVLMARDQTGIKPFYYKYENQRLAFASELNSLVKTGLSSRIINRSAVWQYMSIQCVCAPMTIYEDINELPPAHYLLFDLSDGSIAVSQYWNCIRNRKHYTGSSKEIEEYVRFSVREAVNRWTMSDVPLACSLSGGLDSSILTAIVASAHPLHTYSLGFHENAREDERELSRLVAEKYGTRHTEIIIDQDDLLEALPEMLDAMGTPYAGGLPSWFVFRAISGNEKVAFNGTGGDELFGNYLKWLRYERPTVRLNHVRDVLKKHEKLSEVIKYPSGSIYHKYMTEGLKQRIFAYCPGKQYNNNYMLEQMVQECPSPEWRDVVPFIDFQVQLPAEFLMMLDRFSMHFSIEARTPFLDRELVERILGIEGALRTSRTEPKYLLKESLGDLLPPELLTAEKKGFVLPYREWLREKLKEQVLDLCTGEYIRRQGIFTDDLETLLIRPFYEGDDSLTQLVWTVYLFQKWVDTCNALL